jgi:5-methyltetrahydropteroyltriglutamate--homocysteine methyltransferase
MPIPTEPIGSIPRPEELVRGQEAFRAGDLSREALDRMVHRAVQATLAQFERTGSPVVTDGEQGKPSFATYPIHDAPNVDPAGIEIPFDDGHVRRLPRLTEGPFRYQTYAVEYLERAQQHTDTPVKQAVVSASALSMVYPDEGIAGYPREAFVDDLVDEAEADIRRCLEAGAHAVQVDFTEGRLAVKLDPSGDLLDRFVALNNRVLDRFTDEERRRIGVHTCPGGDRHSTHSADVDYADLLPRLFDLNASRFYMQFASEDDPERVLDAVRESRSEDQTVFLGVIDVNDPEVETPEEVRDTVLQAAEVLPVDRLGTTDDCGFSPFGDDRSTDRRTAFSKIEARVKGTKMAAEELGVAA